MENKKSCGKNEEKRCKRVCGSLAISPASESVESIMWIVLSTGHGCVGGGRCYLSHKRIHDVVVQR